MNKQGKQIKLAYLLFSLTTMIMGMSVKELDHFIEMIRSIVNKRKGQYWQLLEKKRKENFK